MDEWLLKTFKASLPDLGDLTFLKVPSRRGSRGNVVFLAFEDGHKEPRYVVKIARDRQDTSDIAREARILQALEAIGHLYTAVDGTIPRVLHCDPGVGVLIENSLKGRKLRGEFDNISDLRTPRLQHLFDNVSIWLDEFHQVSLGLVDVLRDAPNTQHPNALLEAIREHQFEGIEHPEYLVTLVERTLDSPQLSSTVCHGDFNPYNVLVVDSRVSGVYDWEDWLLGHPLIDRFHFVTVLVGHLPHRDIQRFPERMVQFLESDDVGVQERNLVSGFLTHSAQKWGYDVEFVNRYYLVYLYLMMEKEVRRADFASMLMWRRLLNWYSMRLEREQPGLVLRSAEISCEVKNLTF